MESTNRSASSFFPLLSLTLSDPDLLSTSSSEDEEVKTVRLRREGRLEVEVEVEVEEWWRVLKAAGLGGGRGRAWEGNRPPTRGGTVKDSVVFGTDDLH